MKKNHFGLISIIISVALLVTSLIVFNIFSVSADQAEPTTAITTEETNTVNTQTVSEVVKSETIPTVAVENEKTEVKQESATVSSLITTTIKKIVKEEVSTRTTESYAELETSIMSRLDAEMENLSEQIFEVVAQETASSKTNLYNSLHNELMAEQDALKAELKEELASELKEQIKAEVYADLKASVKAELKTELTAEIKAQLRTELKDELRAELKEELRAELKEELREEIKTDIMIDILNELCAELDAMTEEYPEEEPVVEEVPVAPMLAMCCFGFVPQVNINSNDAVEINTNYVYDYTHDYTVNSLKVTFSDDTIMTGASFINIWYDDVNNGNGSLGTYYGYYTGSELAGKTILIPSDTFRIEFTKYTTDSFFCVNSVEENTDRFTYRIENNEAYITSYNKMEGDTETVIPSELSDGTPVVGIDARVFAYGNACSTVVIPATIRTIADDAFFFDFAINTVKVESLESWFSIDFGSTYSNPCANRQGTMNFYVGNDLVTGVTVPDNITVLKSYSLEQLELNSLDTNKVTTIEKYAIDHCLIHQWNVRSSLTTIEPYTTNFDPVGVSAQSTSRIIFDRLENEIDFSNFIKTNVEIYCMDVENFVTYALADADSYTMSILNNITIYEYGCATTTWHVYEVEITDGVVVLDCENCKNHKEIA